VNRILDHTKALLATGRRHAANNAAGVAVSLLLHGLLVLLALNAVVRHTTTIATKVPSPPFVAVDLVRLADETRSPPAEIRAPIPVQRAGRPQEAASPVPRAVSPNATRPAPLDAIDAKLRALARLRQPTSPLTIGEGSGTAMQDAANGAPGDSATYAVRDYVLAQVLRRWTLDLSQVRNRPLVVRIAVVMKRDGSITGAEIVDAARARSDAVFRDIAIGARNAVLLSSPIPLPPGDYPAAMHFVLALDTRAVVR
jgi:hypothetical protein